MSSFFDQSSRRRFLGVSAGVAALAQTKAWAQEEATFNTGVSVVNTLVSVRDKQGHVLSDLKKEDFLVEEEGRKQEVLYFASQSDLPLTLGLLVDVSGSEAAFIGTERRAAYRFIDQVLREDQDKAFLFRFYRRVEMLCYLSASRAELETALNKLQDPPPSDTQGAQPKGMFFGTALYDAIFIACDTILRKQQGRKALILMTDGEDTGSSTSLSRAIEAAQRADTMIYTLGFFEDTRVAGRFGGGMGGGRAGEDILKRMSRETGGGYFEGSTDSKKLDETYKLIQDELRNQYSLGYVPDDAAQGFRKIRVSVKGKPAIVQARQGYYADAGTQAAAKKPPR